MHSRMSNAADARLAPDGPLLVARSAAMLYHAWNVRGSERETRCREAKGVLTWLAQQGHRASLADPGDREAVIDLLAWDIARGVQVARHAYHAGYVSAAHTAQRAFPSLAQVPVTADDG